MLLVASVCGRPKLTLRERNVPINLYFFLKPDNCTIYTTEENSVILHNFDSIINNQIFY